MLLSRFFSSPLSLAERMRVSWQLTWPSLAIGLGWVLAAFLVIGSVPTILQAAYAFLDLLLISPWVVRRTFRHQFPTFRLHTVRGAVPFPMGYTESFKVMWLLSWRTAVVFLPSLVLVGGLLRALGLNLADLAPARGSAPVLDQIGLALIEDTGFFFLSPLIIPGMFRKQFRDFRVGLERKNQATPPASQPKLKKKRH